VRGAGRPEGVFIMERMLDMAAKELKMDPAEIRRKNLLTPAEFPVHTGIIGQDFVEGVLDTGDYKGNLDRVLEMVDYEKFRKEIQPKARKEGKHLGIGVVTFTEGTSVGPYEGARVTIGNNGKVSCSTGYSTQGQGHYTVFAQIVAEQLNVKPEDVKVITGDTDHFHWGAGTFASRGAAIAGTAMHLAAVKVREKTLATGAKFLEVPVEEVDLCEGYVCVKSDPKKQIPLGELAFKANPMRGTIAPGVEPGLEATAYFAPPYGATGSGAVALILEVDPETIEVKIQRYVIVHDCGTVINPLLLEGQIQGAVSMGLGNVWYEKITYDENGQLLTASFMDYLMPQATDMPDRIEIGHAVNTTPLNPLGIKGVGEAGAIPTPPAFIQALEDALPEYNLELLESNLYPARVYEQLKKDA
jgi:CO/xanthine dehydrogenase Mo-binding subunit